MKVLLVLSNAQLRSRLAELCESLGFITESFTQAETAIEYCKINLVDLVCIEPQLPDASGFDVVTQLQEIEPMRACPILMVCDDVHQALIEKAISSGVTEVFDGQQTDQLTAVLKRYVDSRELISGSVLFVEDSVAQQRVGSSVLKSMGLRVVTATDVDSAWYYFQQQRFDLAIVDIVLEGDASGVELVHRIRRDTSDAGDIPIIVMSAYDDSARRLQLYRLGVEFINKPVIYEEFSVRVRRLIEHRHGALEIKQGREALEQKNKALEQFLGRISHECRNAINISLGVTDRLLRREVFTGKQKDQLEMIVRSSEHLLALVNDILDYSKIEAGALTLQEHRYQPKDLVDKVAKLFALRCQDKGLTLTIDTEDVRVENAFGDEKKISQVLINLLGNAIKFTEAGEIEVGVRLTDSIDSDGQDLEYWVRDTGPGIAAKEMDKLFRAFGQTKLGQNMSEGTGLGLAICAELAQMMSGKMLLEAKEGDGSRFSLLLPMDLESKALG